MLSGQAETLRSFYFALDNTYYKLKYAKIVWSGGISIVLKSILPTQKKAIRIISGTHWRECTVPLFAKLRTLNLFQINKVQVACFMFKVRYSYLPPYFIDIFKINSDVHLYSIRHADDYHI